MFFIKFLLTSVKHHLSPSSAREHAACLSSGGRTILGRFPSLFRLTQYNPHDTPPRPRPLDWTRNIFSGTPRSPNNQDIALQERRKTVVDVPFVKGNRVSTPLPPFSDVPTHASSLRGTSQGQKYGSRKRKKRTRRRLLVAAHDLSRAALHSNPAQQLRTSHLHNQMPLCPPLAPHLPFLLLPLLQIRRPRLLT
jgi:hypothetical protein